MSLLRRMYTMRMSSANCGSAMAPTTRPVSSASTITMHCVQMMRCDAVCSTPNASICELDASRKGAREWSEK